MEFVGAFLELLAQVEGFLFEGDDAAVEGVDVVRGAEAGCSPDGFSEEVGEALFELGDVPGLAGAAFVEVGQAGEE